jgi:hypothetical protein
MCLYGAKDHNPFNTKISQVAYAILATPRILPPLQINSIFYTKASKWNNPILEAIKEARDIWPDYIIHFINISTGIKDPQLLSKQQ